MELQERPGYRMKELTISAGQAQLRSIGYFIPFAVIFLITYYVLWPDNLTMVNYKAMFPGGAKGIMLLVVVMVLGVIVHELIHGFFWASYARSGFRSIRFGILWKSATPYCHCTEPLQVKQYQIGAAAPGILMGILPMVVSLFTGNVLILAFGLFFTMAAGGDLMIILMLKGKPKLDLIQDHPSKIGCVLYEKI